jgi:uncharacterized protein (TIGR01777 family)
MIAGASGLIGRALIASLEADDHAVVRVTSSGTSGPGVVTWNPLAGKGVAPEVFEGVDAVVNLAGINLSEHRWTKATKRRFLASRIESTRLLCEGLEASPAPGRVLVNASAVGFYGDRGNERLTEASSSGKGFLPELCRRWENAADAAAGARVARARFGAVLSPEGGALAQMIPPFKMGTGGWLGRGDQWVSWISLPDAVRAIRFVITEKTISGAVNVTSPNPVSNKEMAKALGRQLHRPAVLGIPRFAAHLVFGEVVDEVGFVSTCVFPEVLERAGFAFDHPEVEGAIAAVLEKGGSK